MRYFYTPSEQDINQAGHADNIEIYRWLSNQRMALMLELGFALGGAAIPAIAEVRLQFKGEILAGSQIILDTRITRIGNSSFDIEQEIYQHDTLCVSSKVAAVNLDKAGKRPQAIPDKIRNRMLIAMENK